jgi:hypothetical protein
LVANFTGLKSNRKPTLVIETVSQNLPLRKDQSYVIGKYARNCGSLCTWRWFFLGVATTNELFSIYVVMPKEHRKAKSL